MVIHGENVLVTGGAGFIGSALVKELVAQDNNVTVLDDFSTGSRENIEDALYEATGERSTEAVDLIDADLLETELRDIVVGNDVSYVFHLAACSFVPESYSRPGTFLRVNAEGTLRLLLACRDTEVERVLHYSTAEVYGKADTFPMAENHPLRPQSTYAASKLAADRLCYTLRHEHELPVTIMRQFNCYGPRETRPRIIPEIITQLTDSPELAVGNVAARRDFTYVDDSVQAAIDLAACPAAEGAVVNVGSGEDYAIREVVDRVAEILGHEAVSITTENDRIRPLDPSRLQCDYTRAQDLIGFEPSVSLTDGLQRTIEWYEDRGRWNWER